jgi:hypothetical protein
MGTIIKRKRKDGTASSLAQIAVRRTGKTVWREVAGLDPKKNRHRDRGPTLDELEQLMRTSSIEPPRVTR